MTFQQFMLEVTDLTVVINEMTPHTLFLSYSGHVGVVEIRIFDGGWVSGASPDKKFEVWGPESSRYKPYDYQATLLNIKQTIANL